MRLVDADALNKTLQERVGSPTDDRLYEVNLCIIDAPTIDAIPVEWLKEQNNSTKYYKTLQGQAVERVLELWEKEQEAKTV